MRYRLSAVAVAAALAGASFGAAQAATGASAVGTRDVAYLGYHFQVPDSWKVVNLADHPSACVRFDQHTVYLGTPSATQDCPAQVTGRTEALLVQPADAAAADRGTVNSAVEHEYVATADHVRVTATYGGDQSLIGSMLIRAGLPTAAPVHALATPKAVSPAVTAAATGVFTGKGFDACAAPSSGAMSAWKASSPYAGIGIYIGGAERGCAQPNLTAGWVSQQAAAGWHFLPIYVGPQAASIGSPVGAGTSAADDAVNQAASLGFGGGTTLYYDMEAYGSGYSGTVLSFLSAWTTELHARGYQSGVYSSSASGIHDLVSKVGTGYAEPDAIYDALWNGVANTDDPAVPASYWANHQRVHQYSGGVTQTYGGVSINVDQDYFDVSSGGAATAAAYPLFHEIRYGDTGDWSGFLPLAGVGGAQYFDATKVAIAGFADGTAQVVAIGNDGKLYHNIRHDDALGTWQGWGEMGGANGAPDFSAGAVAVAAINDPGDPAHNGELHVAAIGNDGLIYYDIRHNDANGTWQGWMPMPGAGGAATFAASTLALTSLTDGTVHIAAVGNTGKLYYDVRSNDAGGDWLGWASMPGAEGAPDFAAGAVAMTGLDDGTVQVVAVGDTGYLYHTVRSNDGTGSWQPWRPLAGFDGATDFAASSVGIAAVNDPGQFDDGTVQVVAVGNTGLLYHDIRNNDASGSWQGWNQMGGYQGAGQMASSTVAIADIPGTHEVHVIATGDQ